MLFRFLAILALAWLYWPLSASADLPGGMTITVEGQAPAITDLLNVDYDRFFASYDNLRHFIPSEWDFRNRPISVAYSMALTAAAGTGPSFAQFPTLQSVTFLAMLDFDSTGSYTGSHELFRFTLTRAQAATIQWGNVNQEDIEAIPGFVMSEWARRAIAVQDAKIDAKLPRTAEDIILDRETLVGKEVRVRGYLACAENALPCFLYSDRLNFTKGLMFDPTNMPRGDRGRLMACNILAPCTAVMVGRVFNNFIYGIQPLTIFWGDSISKARPVTSPPPENPTAGPISVKDFLLDRAKLVGNVVTISGDAQCDASSCWLSETGLTEQETASFDGDALPRADRKKLLDCNQLFRDGCPATVTGRVEGGTVEASSISWGR